MRAGVSPANVDRTVASIDDEVGRMARDGVTAAELADSRRYLIGSMPRVLETNGGIASFLHNAEFFGLGLDYDGGCRAFSSAVTLDEVHDAAGRCSSRSSTVVVAGPTIVRWRAAVTRAVFFDVDFTLIYPGPMFRGEGYRRVLRAARHGRSTSRGSTPPWRARRRFSTPHEGDSTTPRSSSVTPATSSSRWAAAGRASMPARVEIYAEWAACQHFELYDEVPDVLRRARRRAASGSG